MPLTISISGSAPDQIDSLRSDLSAPGSKDAAGRRVQKLLKDYLRQLDTSRPNKIGGKRSHYYADTSRNVSYETTDDGAEVHVHQIGLALHYYGGTIRPTGGRRFLTIPVDPEAYGRRAGEFDNLEIAWGRTQGGKPRPIGLVTKTDWSYQTKKNRKTGVKEVTGATWSAGKWMFALVYSATIQADKSILPEDSTIQNAALSAITDYIISKQRGPI